MNCSGKNVYLFFGFDDRFYLREVNEKLSLFLSYFRLNMFGYLSYLPNVRQVVIDSPIFPFQHLQRQLLAMNTKCLTFFVMLIFITTFLVKASL